MKKSVAWFFGLTLMAAGANTAYAYAITPNGQPVDPQFNSSSFNFGNSLNTLFSPFENFVKSIEQSNQTTINVHGSVAPLPNTRLDVGGYLVQLDDWIYAKTGFRPSGILVVALNVLSWVLGVVKQAVDWLLSLVHA